MRVFFFSLHIEKFRRILLHRNCGFSFTYWNNINWIGGEKCVCVQFLVRTLGENSSNVNTHLILSICLDYKFCLDTLVDRVQYTIYSPWYVTYYCIYCLWSFSIEIKISFQIYHNDFWNVSLDEWWWMILFKRNS